MCGIVGFLAKRSDFRERLGEFVAPMLECMGSRGPDSAGLAVFHEPLADQRRISLTCPENFDWTAWLERCQAELDGSHSFQSRGNHGVLVSDLDVAAFRQWLLTHFESIHITSVGRAIEIFKDEGHPAEIAARYDFQQLSGSHVVAHTRMATESAISPAHAHPFTAGEDFCLVHNGSLSNPHSIRRKLQRRGIHFETDNDTEAGCRFLEWRMREGDTLEQAIERAFAELDGFYTFLMASGDKMVLVRDAFSCKPAIAAETDDYVAVGSEFRALAHLPGIQSAEVFEPLPQEIYSWAVA